MTFEMICISDDHRRLRVPEVAIFREGRGSRVFRMSCLDGPARVQAFRNRALGAVIISGTQDQIQLRIYFGDIFRPFQRHGSHSGVATSVNSHFFLGGVLLDL